MNDEIRSYQCVLSVLKTLKPFFNDGGESGVALKSFNTNDWHVVHSILNPWLMARPGVGGQLYGYQVVQRLGDSRLSIIAPDGKVYVTLDNC